MTAENLQELGFLQGFRRALLLWMRLHYLALLNRRLLLWLWRRTWTTQPWSKSGRTCTGQSGFYCIIDTIFQFDTVKLLWHSHEHWVISIQESNFNMLNTYSKSSTDRKSIKTLFYEHVCINKKNECTHNLILAADF